MSDEALTDAIRHLRAAADALERSTLSAPTGMRSPGTGATRPERRTLADTAAFALHQAGEPVHVARWAAEVRRLGFVHAKPPRNPRQLEQSLSSLPQRDARFVRVGTGVFTLADEQEGQEPFRPRTQNPPWSEEELVLALELYLKRGQPRATDPEVIALSDLLNQLSSQAVDGERPSFRNPNGVHMKLANFKRLDPQYGGKGLTRGGHREVVIWEKYADDPEALRSAAELVRARITT